MEEKKKMNNELVLIETSAQISLVNKKVKGTLALTPKCLHFCSSNGGEEITFDLGNITQVYKYKTLGLFNKGFYLVYKNEVFKLKVDYSNDWLDLIRIQLDH